MAIKYNQQGHVTKFQLKKRAGNGNIDKNVFTSNYDAQNVIRYIYILYKETLTSSCLTCREAGFAVSSNTAADKPIQINSFWNIKITDI